MIVVTFNKPEFEYDVHSLLKSFYPKEDIEMYYTCPEEEAENANAACKHHSMGPELDRTLEEAQVVFAITYTSDKHTVVWERKDPESLITKLGMVGLQGDQSDEDYRKLRKNVLKQTLYDMLSEGLNQKLPWGSLTGIRPTKIPMKMLKEGSSDQEIHDYMKETYFTSEEKIKLSTDIAKRELALLSKLDYEKGYSLYVGIPFCPSTCLYCSFTSYPLASWRKKVDIYLDALEKELEYTAETFRDRKLNSIYIGGGTPTTLEPAQLDRLIKKIKSLFDLSSCLEFTVEAGRPDSITREKLQVLHDNGIDRISVNPQTMKQETLDIIGRHHTVEQTIESYRLAREVGFSNINMDLILGLPEESIEDVRRTMEIVTDLRPENITIHSLAIKRAARLTIFKDRYQDMAMVNTQEHMELCADYCHRIGLEPYYMYRQKGMAGNLENVGYALEGKAGVYNILIMEEVQTIVACGAGTVSKNVHPDGRIDRCDNVKDVNLYIEKIDEMIGRKRGLFTNQC